MTPEELKELLTHQPLIEALGCHVLAAPGSKMIVYDDDFETIGVFTDYEACVNAMKEHFVIECAKGLE